MRRNRYQKEGNIYLFLLNFNLPSHEQSWGDNNLYNLSYIKYFKQCYKPIGYGPISGKKYTLQFLIIL